MKKTTQTNTEEKYITLAQLEKLWLEERRKKEAIDEDTLQPKHNQNDHANNQDETNLKQSTDENSVNWESCAEQANGATDASNKSQSSKKSRKIKRAKRRGKNKGEKPKGIENGGNPEKPTEKIIINLGEHQAKDVTAPRAFKRESAELCTKTDKQQWRRKEDSTKDDTAGGTVSSVDPQMAGGNLEIGWNLKSAKGPNEGKREKSKTVVAGGDQPTAEIESKLEGPAVDARVGGEGKLRNYRRRGAMDGRKVKFGRTKQNSGMVWVRKGLTDRITGK